MPKWEKEYLVSNTIIVALSEDVHDRSCRVNTDLQTFDLISFYSDPCEFDLKDFVNIDHV